MDLLGHVQLRVRPKYHIQFARRPFIGAELLIGLVGLLPQKSNQNHSVLLTEALVIHACES